MTVELKHNWNVHRNAWYIRLYAYAWSIHSFVDASRVGVDTNNVTFCKLWWGYLLMPVAFLVFKPFVHLIDLAAWIAVTIGDARQARRVRFRRPKVDPRPLGPSIFDRFLEKVGEVFTLVSLRVQPIWLTIRKPMSYLLLVVGILGGVAVTAWGLLIAVDNIDVVVTVVKWVAIAVIVVVLAAFGGAGLNRIGFWVWAGTITQRGTRRFGYRVKRRGLGFFGAMHTGYVAVKSNTCPKVNLIDGE